MSAQMLAAASKEIEATGNVRIFTKIHFHNANVCRREFG